MAIYNINLSSHSAGGKKKPLKAPKKQNKDLDDVRGINNGSIILIGMPSRAGLVMNRIDTVPLRSLAAPFTIT